MAESTRATTTERDLRDRLFNITYNKLILSGADQILGERLLSNIYKITRETATNNNSQKKYYLYIKGRRVRQIRRAKALTSQRNKLEHIVKLYTVTIVVSIEYDDGGYISSVVVARGSNKDPYIYTLWHYDLRSENTVLKDTT